MTPELSTPEGLHQAANSTAKDPISVTLKQLVHRRMFWAGNSKIMGDVMHAYVPVGTPILELGAGTGELARMLPPEYAVQGPYIQTEPEALLFAETTRDLNAQRAPFEPGIDRSRPTIIAADALHLPFPDNSQSTVVAFDLIDMVNDTAGLTGEVGRVLRPGGTFIHFHDIRPNLDWTQNQLSRKAVHFPQITDGILDRFQSVDREVFKKARRVLPEGDVEVLDDYVRRARGNQGLEHMRTDHPEATDAVAAVVRRNSHALRPKVSPQLRDVFTSTTTKALKRAGFDIVTAQNIEEQRVQASAHSNTNNDVVGYARGTNGEIHFITEPDVPLGPGEVLLKTSLHVVVAHKKAPKSSSRA